MPFAIVVGAGGLHVATVATRVVRRRTLRHATVIWIEAELDGDARIAVEIFSGNPHAVLAAFLARTGRPVLPPTGCSSRG